MKRAVIGAMRGTPVGGVVSYETKHYQDSLRIMQTIQDQKNLPLYTYRGGHEIDPVRHRVDITITGKPE